MPKSSDCQVRGKVASFVRRLVSDIQFKPVFRRFFPASGQVHDKRHQVVGNVNSATVKHLRELVGGLGAPVAEA